MKTILFSREAPYEQAEVTELESASVKVQLMYDKVLHMLYSHLPSSVWDRTIGVPYEIISSLYKGYGEGTVFQKWIKGPSGWKCIGCERHCLEQGQRGQPETEGQQRTYTFHNGRRQSLLLQVVIWSLYEKTMLLHPFLGGEAFLEGEELEMIAAYFVPTFVHNARLRELGKPWKAYTDTGIRVYQEWVSAPDIILQWDGGLTEGRWMTGVYVNEAKFAGLGPYLKDAEGRRTYMDAYVH
ncbi:hypothetical protein KIH86_12100 [Paenibacillus sp. HN-1]|uniref:hypothetical protein n=1 Tax=Paenibacillus TaxID=44249 RepID=UPI001CA8D9FD|nr:MULTISPECIES: hypothetical protein [Paenibacillus]MBY9081445.1 hypothetical protein [Paenibacillus sp. CGMCC 1.18879]MBY9084965.1 hypothetical protein [Paenibacillus sinensis]